MKDFLIDWLRGVAVCAGCATLADLALWLSGLESIEAWRWFLFVLGVPLLQAGFMALVSKLMPWLTGEEGYW